MNTFTCDEHSTLRISSLPDRRRRRLRDARPRLTSWPRLRKSNIAMLFARFEGGPAMGLIRADDGAHQFVSHNIAFGEVYRRDSGHSL